MRIFREPILQRSLQFTITITNYNYYDRYNLQLQFTNYNYYDRCNLQLQITITTIAAIYNYNI
jgi:hypothetical protein